MRCCMHCKAPILAASGFYELIRQPAGEMYTTCSLRCLSLLIEGGSD